MKTRALRRPAVILGCVVAISLVIGIALPYVAPPSDAAPTTEREIAFLHYARSQADLFLDNPIERLFAVRFVVEDIHRGGRACEDPIRSLPGPPLRARVAAITFFNQKVAVVVVDCSGDATRQS